MRATQVVSRGRVEFVEVPKPEVGPGQALIRPLLLALCGSDVHRVYYAADEAYPFPPGTSGHEMIGVVEAVDAPGHGLREGDVALVLSPVENAMSEWYLAEADDVLVLPPGAPLEHLLMAQQLGTVIFGGKVLPNFVGQDVAIIGQGSAGLFFDYWCRRLGAERVIGFDLHAARVAAGARFGATHTVNNSEVDPVQAVAEITGGKMADLVIEAAGDVEAINLAPHLVRVGGHLHYFGVPRAQRFMFDFTTLYRKYCHTTSLAGTAHEPGRRSVRQALDLVASGAVDVSPLVTHWLPFERAPEGYELARTCADGAIKVVIEMPGYQPARR